MQEGGHSGRRNSMSKHTGDTPWARKVDRLHPTSCASGKVLEEKFGRKGLKHQWRRKLQPTPLFLPGKFHGQRSLEGYRPWVHKESDTTQRLSTHIPSNLEKLEKKVAQSCLTVSNPMDCSLPGSSVLGILQARILEWVAMLSSRGSSQTQGLNPGLLHCRRILYCLSHQGSCCCCCCCC